MQLKMNAAYWMGMTLAVLSALTLRAERIALTNGHATCEIDTQGACIRSYRVGAVEVLWTSPAPAAADAPWAHGGIPLAWPWFGRVGSGDANIHGYAWKSAFSVRSRAADRVTLELVTESAVLEYSVSLDPSLKLQLRTVNRSRHDMLLGQAFHPYFRVAERNAAIVEGVFPEPLSVTERIDRSVKFDKVVAHFTCRLRDTLSKRVLAIDAEGLTGINVWNPGSEPCPGRIPGDEWRHFVAIEPMAMGYNRFFVLKPGEENRFSMTVMLL